MPEPDYQLDPTDRLIIEATQKGLPVTQEPYAAIANSVGLSTQLVMQRMQRMLDAGVIRRIGAVPNHYALGYKANGMSVWDVPDEKIDQLGNIIGKLDFVSHCYHRPRQLPEWPYNLFAMVHGRDKESTQAKVKEVAGILGKDNHGHDVLYSSRILKKTGLRLNIIQPKPEHTEPEP